MEKQKSNESEDISEEESLDVIKAELKKFLLVQKITRKARKLISIS